MTDTSAKPQATSRSIRLLASNTWTAIKSWLRRDGLVIALYVFATLLMSYPLLFKLGGDWLALRDTDTYMKLWDNWWFQNYALKGASRDFTNMQFHPSGLDLSYHSISWTVALFTWILTRIVDSVTAYNLTIFAALFAAAYTAYLLVRPFLRYRAAAWLAGAVYSYAPYHLAHSGGHPDLVHLAPIPLAVLLLYKAITRTSLLAALGAALMVAISGFTSLYIMVIGLLTIGPVLIFLLLDERRWSQKQTWRIVILFGIASALLLSIRLVPIFRDTGDLAEAIELKYTANLNQADLLSYILPSHLNPIFAPYTNEIASSYGNMSNKWPAYLGLIPLTLAVAALTWKKYRKFTFLWFSIGLVFVILSLGPILRLNGVLYEEIRLPGYFLSWFAPIRAVGRPQFFVMGVLLPLAVLAAFGFDRLLRALEGRRAVQLALMVAVPGLLLLEYWSGEFPGLSTNVSPFYEQLSREEGDFAIIQLPMGRAQSKEYLYLQTIHQKPIVEGLSGRTPTEAYQYIKGNPLLQKWSHGVPINCRFFGSDRFISAVDQLVDDGFRYVVVHHPGSTIPDHIAGYFPPESFYQDGELTAYGLAELRGNSPCEYLYDREIAPLSPAISTSIVWDESISLLGYDDPIINSDSQTLSINVYWQAHSLIDNSYTVYLHLVDSETGMLSAQADVIPQDWSYPTDWWAVGEVVEDTIQLNMDSASPGNYELRIGWYDQETGERLIPVSEQIYLLPDGSASLIKIEY